MSVGYHGLTTMTTFKNWKPEEIQFLLHSRRDHAEVARVLRRSLEDVQHFTRYYNVMTEEVNPLEEKVFLWERATKLSQTFRGKRGSKVVEGKKKGGRSGRTGNAYRNTKTGIREDIGINCRSSWEANFARILGMYGIKYQFEPEIFIFHKIKRGTRAYTPDFYLPKTDEWIEIKGYMDDASRIKLKRFKQFYPEQFDKLTMVISANNKHTKQVCRSLGVRRILYYENLSREYKDRIATWEGR
jgi:hypothetical protein